ncbi:hypothetical protein E2320_018124 [Naja naja]|nr:hypothetical protein E2320_018124 [Naja naja]
MNLIRKEAEKCDRLGGFLMIMSMAASFQDPALYTSWLNPPETLRIWNTPRAFNKYEKSASLVSNSQFLLSPLNSLVGKAWKMFASKAYIHQYSKFGIEEDDFLGCFTTLEQVIASYSSL